MSFKGSFGKLSHFRVPRKEIGVFLVSVLVFGSSWHGIFVVSDILNVQTSSKDQRSFSTSPKLSLD